MCATNPKVSVCLSIYNVENYLEECLNSIIAQSYNNLEIVCVNNGSPDKSGAILKKYARKDRRIKIITLKENRMVCGGRNAGLDNATGEFICFVDPDDYIEGDYIKNMVQTILSQEDPEGHKYNLVMNTSVIRFIQDGKNRKIIERRQTNGGCRSIDDYNHDTFLEIGIPMWGRLYRTDFIKKHKIRFIEGMHTDNIPFTTKLLAHMKYWYIITATDYPNSAYCYRLATMDGCITPIIAFKSLELPQCLENLYDYLKEIGLSQKVKIMYYNFFNAYFPRHEDMPRYYNAFKHLMKKMENDIKNAPDSVYQRCDKDLCNYLLYTDNFFQFSDLYFRPIQIATKSVAKYTLKLFGIIPILKKRTTSNSIKYKILGVPVWKIKIKNDIIRCYLFDFIPLLKYIKK